MEATSITEKFKRYWQSDAEIVMYGYGRQGKSYLPYLQKIKNIRYVIDNSCAPGCEKHIGNITLLNYTDFKKIAPVGGCRIVITAAGRAHMSITECLDNDGLKEFEDYMDADFYISLMGWLNDNQVRLGRASIPVTEVCTLKCEKCSVCVPHIQTPTMYSADMLNNDIDNFFKYVDHVACLLVFGGEPFTNKDFYKYIHHVGRNYLDRIDNFQIVSNGTVEPDDNLIEALKCYKNIDMRFSDYTDFVPYQKKFENVKKIMEINNIPYRIERFDWLDMGNPNDEICMGTTPQSIRKHMSDCCGRCQTYHNGKYYFCTRQWGAERAYGMEMGDDVIRISEREKIIPFHIGMMEKGYCEFCNKCKGYDRGEIVKAGVQIKR